jgi:FHS family Na+ dependent glucose MFS transporter 1
MKNKSRDKTVRIRLITLYYSAYIYLGMAAAIIGPSLLKLVEQTGSNLTRLSLIFPIRAGSYLLGSWLVGPLFDRPRSHRLLALGLVVMGISLGLVPLAINPTPLFLTLVAMGVAMAAVDVGGSSLLFRIRGINLGPAMNGLHFFFGLGSFLSPLILAGSFHIDGQIQRAFLGLGLFSLFILVLMIRLEGPEASQEDAVAGKGDDTGVPSYQRLLIPIIMLFFFAYVGTEVGYGDWLSTYSLTSGLADEKGAVLLTSLYWGAFTAGRLVSIPLAMKLKANNLLAISLTGAVAGLGLVLFSPSVNNLMWIGTMVLGFSLSSIFPTMLTYSERLMSMSGKTTSWFFISGSIGSAFAPWIIGRFIERTGPGIITRVLFIFLIMAAGVFSLLTWLTKNHPQNGRRVV